ncbi:MAG: DUF488 domain-containing protein [Deltaproteobacteria bacterium]|nr:DUF488 domain-containing protein [Deltaproteobacteria bacterium]
MLSAHRIDRVIDVRDLPLSRRRGFSKTPLATALTAHGIEYVHLRQAGNPFRREKDSIPREERRPETCHRSILSPRVARRLGLRQVDL